MHTSYWLTAAQPPGFGCGSVQAEDTCGDVLLTRLETSGETWRSQIKAGRRYRRLARLPASQLILSYTNLQALRRRARAQTSGWVLLWFLSLGRRCRGCRGGLFVCRVLRALVQSVLLWLVWLCVMCLSVCLYMCMILRVPVVSESGCTARRGVRVTDYRKALGFARGSFWFL